MFTKIGKMANKYRFYILAFWLLLAAVLTFTAPPLSEVGITDQSQFLPLDTDSARVRDILNDRFAAGSDTLANSFTILVYNEQGLNQQDMDRAKNINDWLLSADKPEAVSQVTSIFTREPLRSTLISQDNQAMLMNVDLSVQPMDTAAKQAVKDIRARMEQEKGTVFYLTGNVGLVNDLFDSVQKTIDRTTLVTILLVIFLLLLVYRSPVAALVPLIAIGLSFLSARGIVGFLAGAGVSVSTLTDAYLVVTIFGVGTDYCLFIISRFREELAQGDRLQSIQSTMKRIGPIILASAVTVVIAFCCLSISRFAMTRTSGWALAIGIAVTLVAGITLVPAMMAIFGKYLFWLAHGVKAHKEGGFGWARIGKWVAGRPVAFIIPIVIILVLPYFVMPDLKLSANVLSQLPENVEAARGFDVLRAHFNAAETTPVVLLVQSKDNTPFSSSSLENIDKAAQSLADIDIISRVDYYSAPAGKVMTLNALVRSLNGTLSAAPDFTKLAALQTMAGDLQSLAIRYPGLVQSQNFGRAAATLSQLSAAVTQVRTAAVADMPTMIGRLQGLLTDLSAALTGLADEFELKGNTPFTAWLRGKYFSADNTVTRLNLVLRDDPYSESASEAVPQLREKVAAAIESSELKGSPHYIGGNTAMHYDMLKVSDNDLIRVMVVAAIGILAVIIILMRSLLAPLYMVLTVLFNYGATLGITTWLFLDVLNRENLMYLLPVFVFVMLVAVGADYNIFLVSRIREEAETRPIKEAVQRAVAHTGGVITSCGIILAGTFATLATSSLPMVLQIGAAIALGVIIDTFIVRAMLVPSLAAVAGRWSWWPSALFKKK